MLVADDMARRSHLPSGMNDDAAQTEPLKPDWVLIAIHDSGEGNYYRYRVSGLNLNYPPTHPSHRFSWSVPSISDPRYDTTNAVRTHAAS